MENVENYTSLQEFAEDMSSTGRPALLTKQRGSDMQRMKRGVDYMKKQTIAILVTVLLASICVNIALGVLLYNKSSITPCTVMCKLRHAPESSNKLEILSHRYSMLCKDYSDLAKNCTVPEIKVKQCSPCPSSWLQFEDRCYYFSKEKMTWEESKASCENMSSQLAILHSHKQHDALEAEATKSAGYNYYFWIGLSDKETEGDWRWVDNSTVNNTYWNIAEPDNHMTGGIHGEDCAVLNARSKTWSDVPCNFMYNHICEMEAIEIA